MDAFFFQHLGGADALPGGGNLDEHALAADANLVVLRDDAASLGDGAGGVIREASVHFRRDAPWDDGQNLFAEGDGQPLKGEVGDGRIGPRCPNLLAASSSTPSTMG